MTPRIFSSLLSLLLLMLISTAIYSQERLTTFEMEFDGEKVLATQDVDVRLLGTYIQKEGKCKRMFAFGKDQEESYTLTQTINDPFSKSYDWDPNQKQSILWGVLTVEGKLAYMQVSEFEDGNMRTYTGIVIIYKDLKTQKYKDMLLYEVNGNLVLGGFATKVTEVVAN